MSGRATLTTLTSSSDMNVPRKTASTTRPQHHAALEARWSRLRAEVCRQVQTGRIGRPHELVVLAVVQHDAARLVLADVEDPRVYPTLGARDVQPGVPAPLTDDP